MKKLVLMALASTFAATALTAAPVTNIEQGQSKIQAEYAFSQSVTNGGGSNNDGFGVSLEHDLTDKLALQYGYEKVNAKNGDVKDHQLALVYAVHNNVNVYGAGTYIREDDNKLGFQGGIIGHTQLTDKIEGYAKAGFGNDIKQSYQIGAAYALQPDVALNVYYGYDKYSVDDNDRTKKGLHAGVGFSF